MFTYNDIPGYFDFEHVYDIAVTWASPNANFIEIGAWLGRSSCYMGTKIKDSGKKINFWVVDSWAGSGGTDPKSDNVHEETLKNHNGNIYSEFSSSVDKCGLASIITPLQMWSLEAAAQFTDGFFDFIYIDAAHDYKSVLADICAWWPKCKIGGIIGGHDYQSGWESVTQAVNECFQHVTYYPPHSSWWVKKSQISSLPNCVG